MVRFIEEPSSYSLHRPSTYPLRDIQKPTLVETWMDPSPFNRLPTELAVEIFKQMIPTPVLHPSIFIHLDPSPRSSFARKEAPILLGWVCKHWRNILYATPQMWTTLEIWGLYERDWNIVMIKDWLRRSAELPLTLVYGPSFGNGHISDQDLEVLKSISHRCQNVTFSLFPGSLGLLAPLKGSFQKIQSLTIVTSWHMHLNDVFQDAPLLHTFRIVAPNPLPSMRIPHAQLTEFVCFGGHDRPIEECIALLRDCPNLISCTFPAIRGYHNIGPVSNHVAVHNRLQVLAITHSYGLPSFFQATSFPSLREIRFNGFMRRSGGIKRFNELGSAFWNPIQRLRMCDPSTASDMAPLLKLMPSLVEIEFDQPPSGLSLLLEAFVPTARRPLLAPCLHTLTIRATQPEGIIESDRTTFIRMLRYRCQVAAEVDPPLTPSIKIVRIKGSGAERLVDMVQVQKEGLGGYIDFIERGV